MSKSTRVGLGVSLAAVITASTLIISPSSATVEPSASSSSAAKTAISREEKTPNEPVELVGQRTATSETFRNPDGTMTLKEFAGPVHVKQDGKWVDVDYDLVKQVDGSYAPKAAPAEVAISGGGTKLATEVTFDDGQTLGLSWPTTLPTPSIDGGVATYKISPTTDLIVAMTGTGVATRIRLNEAPAPDDSSWSLGLRADGLNVDQTAPGKLKFSDGNTTLGTTTQMVAWDDSTDRAGDPTNFAPVIADLTASSSAGDVSKHELALSASSAFLQDPDTQYPVIIDPDINAVSGGKSTWMRKDTPASTTNLAGQYHRLLVGRVPGADNANHAMSYLGWSNSQIAGKPITSAELGVYQYDAGACAARTLMAHPLVGSFTVNTEYANRPDVNINTGDSVSTTANPGSDNAGCTSANNWVKLDVTEMAKAWAAGTYTNYGVRLNVPSDNLSDASYSRRLCSSKPDSSQGTCSTTSTIPYLKISWNNAPAVPGGLGGTPCVDCQINPLVINSRTASLRAVLSDPDGGAINGQFEVWDGHAATPTTRRSTGTASASSGGTAAFKINTLPDGDYSFRVRAYDGTAYSNWSAWKRISISPEVPNAERGTYVGVVPTRAVDTTTGTGGSSTPFAAGETRSYQFTGVAGVPTTNVTAYVLDVSSVSTTATRSALVGWPTGHTNPGYPWLTFGSSTPAQSNMAIVKPGGQNKVNIQNTAGTTHMRVSVIGYFTKPVSTAPDGLYATVEAARVLDTTSVDGPTDGASLLPGRELSIEADTVGEIPDGTKSVYANVTVSGTSSVAGQAKLKASSAAADANAIDVSYPGSGQVTRGVFLNLENGAFTVRNPATGSPFAAQIDVLGYFTGDPSAGGSYTPLSPRSLYKSTDNNMPLAAGESRVIGVDGYEGVPDENIGAVAIGATVSNYTAPGTIQAGDADITSTVPISTFDTATGNPAAGITNTAVVPTSVDGQIVLRNTSTSTVNVTVNIVGYFRSQEKELYVVGELPAQQDGEVTASGASSAGVNLNAASNGDTLVTSQAQEKLDQSDDNEPGTPTPVVPSEPNQQPEVARNADMSNADDQDAPPTDDTTYGETDTVDPSDREQLGDPSTGSAAPASMYAMSRQAAAAKTRSGPPAIMGIYTRGWSNMPGLFWLRQGSAGKWTDSVGKRHNAFGYLHAFNKHNTSVALIRTTIMAGTWNQNSQRFEVPVHKIKYKYNIPFIKATRIARVAYSFKSPKDRQTFGDKGPIGVVTAMCVNPIKRDAAWCPKWANKAVNHM